MKSITELRNSLRFSYHEINSSVRYFADCITIDFNVFLPNKGMNLQRDFVWTLEQKRELIWSVLMNRGIPRMAMVHTVDDVYQVIDGKQRLSAMIGFYRNEYTLEIDETEYLFDELPDDYQRVIGGYMFPYYVVDEYEKNQITDDDKISWFRYINFVGTPQDAEHMNKLCL